MIPPNIAAYAALWWVKLLFCVALVLLGFWAGMAVQGWRMGNQIEAQKAAFAEAALVAERKAAATAAILQKGVDDARTRLDVVAATIDAKDDEIGRLRVDLTRLRADADRLRRAAGGLRQQLDEYAAGASASHGACIERVNQLAGLANRSADLLREGAERSAAHVELAEEGRTVAQRCGRDHAIAAAQVKELIAAWPQSPNSPPP
jgi:hypothetical protein